ncbi:hypothetical protein MRX96_024489 [Rhipicephalus microplus]
MPMATPYSMTKHALVSMVDGLRRECYGKGVDIISVMPQAYNVRECFELVRAFHENTCLRSFDLVKLAALH